MAYLCTYENPSIFTFATRCFFTAGGPKSRQSLPNLGKQLAKQLQLSTAGLCFVADNDYLSSFAYLRSQQYSSWPKCGLQDEGDSLRCSVGDLVAKGSEEVADIFSDDLRILHQCRILFPENLV
jgi:hypothetical protein